MFNEKDEQLLRLFLEILKLKIREMMQLNNMSYDEAEQIVLESLLERI